MPYYPINLDLRRKSCLIVGGGEIAERKISPLLACGGSVTVASPVVTEGIRRLAEQGVLTVMERPFAPEDIEGKFLVIAATDDRDTNIDVSAFAQERGILVNVVDDPDLCTFTVPATVVRGDLLIAISTGGGSPALAKRIRKELEGKYGPEYALLVDLMSELRPIVRKSYSDQKDREAVYHRVLDAGVLEMLAGGRLDEARERALECI